MSGRRALNWLNRPVHRPLMAALLGVVLVVGVGIMLVGSTPADSTNTVRLRDVTPERLAANGIQLVPPPSGEHAVVAMAAAEQAASLRGRPGATTSVREAVLAQVVEDGSSIDRLCWVVSLDPTGWFKFHGPPTASHEGAKWFLVYIDAITGDWIGSDAGD